MNFFKEHKIQILFLLAIVVIGIVIAYKKEDKQPEMQPTNIFEEIYQETNRTFKTGNTLGNIDDFDIDTTWPQSSWTNPMSEEFNIENKPWGRIQG